MNWQERQRYLFYGAPLTLVPALAFLPAFAFLLLSPAIPHAQALAAIALPCLALAQVLGMLLVALACSLRKVDLITLLGFAVLMLLFVISIYTGLFFAAFAGRLCFS
jgi:hypothetical protein